MRWWKWLLVGAVVWRAFGPKIQPRFKPPQEHPLRIPGKTVFVGDDEFLVREMGPDDDPVPILVVHGLAGASLTEWYQVAPKLAVNRRVIMIDHRGHGLSAMGDSRFDVEDDADDVAGVLEELGVGAVDVVGYSMGGAIAQSFTKRHPGRVRKLVLMATFATHSEGYRWSRRIGAILARAWERLTGFGTPEVRSGYLIASQAVRPEHARWLWHEGQRRGVESGAQASFALLRFDSRDWVGKLDVPTLVVIPTGDLLVPPRWQYELAEAIGGSELVEVSGARHELVWTHSDRVADELSKFLS
ncbi:MAG TPA: alpha/beta hydrolase [Acidimicrobiia bacterium]|jgi:pimeloyl-ACP methyl ester carboxylesterase|nr:alpha/beta hydrolase [Acidimicrobiia bacterium]